MSDAVTDLNGASYDGLVRIKDAGLQGMITLRGDPGSAAFRKAATGVTGTDMPGQGQERCDGPYGICWMSPDEVMVLCPYEEVGVTLTKMRTSLGKAHALAVDVSDARASFILTGPHVREVIAKLCPVDMLPGAFEPGMFRRTRMAQVPAAFWMRDAQTVQVIVFRSVGQYVFDLLCAAGRSGSAVDIF